MPDIRKHSSTSNLIRVRFRHATTGAGLTGLTSASAGLIISTIADNEAAATSYTVAGSTIETIATLGTFAAPTATKCRFKEVDATNHPGLYELQFADARFAVASAKRLVVSWSGATNLLDDAYEIELVGFDPFDAVRLGLTAFPNVAQGNSGALPTGDANGKVTLAPITHTSAVIPTVSVLTGHTAQTGDSFARLGAPAGASHAADIAAVKNDSAAILADTGTDGVVVAAASKTGYSLSAAGVQAIWDALTSAFTTVGSIGKLLVDRIDAAISSRLASASYTAPPSAAANADAVWDEARSGHVAAGSFGEGVASVQGNVTGSAASVTGAVGSVTGAVGSVTGNVGGNVVGSVGSISGVTFPTNFGSLSIDASGLVRLSPTGVGDILTTALVESYAADGAAPTLSQLQFMIWGFLAERSVSGTTMTVKKLDGATAAMTFTLNDASAPTSIARAS